MLMPLPDKHFYTSEDYWSLPEGERAELIDGELYAMAPPSYRHQKLISEFTQAIGSFIKAHDGSCEVIPAPFAVNLDADDKNWVEPDINVICDQKKLTDRGCNGAPDFIIEIVSPSTQGMDYLKKFLLYQRHGVREYWIVNPVTESVMVYRFEEDNSAPYSFQDTIPVGIYGGELKICIADFLR
jgi:Uma2 family endonuclease